MPLFGAGKKINKINDCLLKALNGDLESRIDIPSQDSLGSLARKINSLVDKLAQVEKDYAGLQGILNSMVEGVVSVDRDTRIVSFNPAITKIFGTPENELKGRLFIEAIRNNDIAEVITMAIVKGERISREISLLLPVRKTFQVNASPILEKDSISGCLIVIHDVTEMRHLETVRRDFVANVSHELKTPLTSIKGFVETLAEGALEDKENSRRFLGIIQNQTDRLHKLINDLLELSYLESREIKLDSEKVNLFVLAESIISGFSAASARRKVSIANNLSLGLSVNCDKEMIEQVFVNLLDNAVKFNRENGFVKIYQEESDKYLKIIVEDSGAGIPEKDLPRIFERFYRIDKARSRELGGTGLGLSIVKHIIELHRGEVGVESIEGLGSKFWFTLPR